MKSPFLAEGAEHFRILRVRASRRAARVALSFGLLAASALAVFFVYGVGFRHAGAKFILLYIGMFLGAPVVCVLATFGVYFITLMRNSPGEPMKEAQENP
jgi:hypothetical protein